MSQSIRGSADIPTDGECYFCFDYCTDVDYCEGCKEFVCDECLGGADSSFSHDVDEHGDTLDD